MSVDCFKTKNVKITVQLTDGDRDSLYLHTRHCWKSQHDSSGKIKSENIWIELLCPGEQRYFCFVIVPSLSLPLSPASISNRLGRRQLIGWILGDPYVTLWRWPAPVARWHHDVIFRLKINGFVKETATRIFLSRISSWTLQNMTPSVNWTMWEGYENTIC